jgi:hypothetical protein
MLHGIELAATSALIGALLAQKKQADAEQEAEKSRPLAAKSQNMLARLQFELWSARVFLASDIPKSSRLLLENILRQGHDRRLVGVEFEARLGLAELEEKSRHPAQAQQQLISLEKSAHQFGFELVAGKAAAMNLAKAPQAN